MWGIFPQNNQMMDFYHKKLNDILEQQADDTLTPESEPYIIPYSTLTDDISPANYSVHDLSLRSLLKDDFMLMESEEDKKNKENALIKINDILRSWMDRVNESLNIKVNDTNPNTSANYARLLCYGSYKLGVSSPNGDIDALVLSPSYVDRDKHFFGTLFDLLVQYSKDNENIKELTSINYEHSITPLITMEFYGVNVDLIFAKVDNINVLDGYVDQSGLSERPSLYDDTLLKSMDDKMKRSYNGFRNAEMILDSIIPESTRRDHQKVKNMIENYRMLLRCVKVLAKANGISENKVGYLGGIAYAILASKIFQLFPNYNFCHLIERFLYIYGFVWNWDKWWVRIVEERDSPQTGKYVNTEEEPKGFQQSTDFLYPKKFKQRCMNIITPAWPQMNSAYNVSFSTREVILKAFRQKHEIILRNLVVDQINNENYYVKESWKSFFKKFEFFKEHDQFIELILVGTSEDQFLKWRGFIEAKIRLFIEKLETLMSYFDFELQIWPNMYEFDEVRYTKRYHDNVYTYNYFEKIYIGLTLNQDYDDSIDLTNFLNKFLTRIDYDWNKENSHRNPQELNLFIYMLDREDLVLGEGIEVDKLLSKRDQIESTNISTKKEEHKGFDIGPLFKTVSSNNDVEDVDNEELMDRLLD